MIKLMLRNFHAEKHAYCTLLSLLFVPKLRKYLQPKSG